MTAFAPANLAALLCAGASGSITGNATLDEGRCVVVAIVLGNNGLTMTGDLSGILDRMPELQVLELNNNRLTGPLQAVAEWAEAQRSPFKLVRLALHGNAFEYRAGTVETLVAVCGGSGERCSGLPPRSCEAFGQSFELDLKDPNQCQECPFVHITLLVIGTIFLCSLLAGVVYIALILRHGEATTGVGQNVCIVCVNTTPR